MIDSREFPDSRSWFKRNKWLMLRRLSQISIQVLFLMGPWFGIWWFKGNLSANLLFEIVPLTDPFIFTQLIASGFWPSFNLILGFAIVVGFYLLVGGRVFCSWVCPVNLVTDLASWMRRKLSIKKSTLISRKTRYWLLGALLITTALSGVLVWEIVNPVSILTRGLVFGIGTAAYFIVAVFLFDLFVSKNGWCGHLCPMGAFYSVLGKASIIKMSAPQRSKCDDCMDCYYVCPEPQVLRPILKGDSDSSFIINASECTNCGRCEDVCPQLVFEFNQKFVNQSDSKFQVEKAA